MSNIWLQILIEIINMMDSFITASESVKIMFDLNKCTK